VKEPGFAQRFISGFVVAGLGALAVLGVFVLYKLFHATGETRASDLVVGWLIGSFGLALAGGIVRGARLWDLWLVWARLWN
jgi:hypothetical protein